jgi:hypothetical protein
MGVDMKTTLVTAFYDIGRSNWESPMFRRKTSEYIDSFSVFLKYGFDMIIFIDERHYDSLKKLVDASPNGHNKRLISINELWMQKNIWAWSKLDREKKIMASAEYQRLIPHRVAAKYPENVNPEYTIMTHSKVDFVGHVIDNNLSDSEILIWVDFGYFHNKVQSKHLPHEKIDVSKIDPNLVHLCGILPIDDADRDVLYTLRNAPVKICAYLFGGTKDMLKKFQGMAHEALEFYQENNIADDEQAVWLHCFFRNKDIFKIELFPEWHMGFKYYTKEG